MLISKSTKYDPNALVTFKLANGDEIIGRVSEETDTHYTLERPCTVVPSQKGIMLIASLFTADPAMDITISKSHVLFHAPSAREVQDYYIKTTTGIESVNPGGIITGL
jgi:hypothetical protein